MSYANDAAAVSGKAPADRDGLCTANGCPLPGGLSSSTSGSEKWLCRVHFGQPYALHDGITARINNRVVLYDIAGWLSNRGSGERAFQDVRDRIKALGRAELLKPPTPGVPFTAQGLAAFIFSVLDNECRAPQKDMGTPTDTTNWIDEPEAI